VSKHLEDAMPTCRTTRAPFAVGSACAITILLGSARAAAQPSYSHSPDERQLAWSAWIAGHDRIDAAQPMLERIVAERIDAFPSSPPVDYALDALIQLEAHLTPDLLARIVEQRPVACSRRAVPPATPRGCSPGSASARGSRYRTAARIARSAGLAMASAAASPNGIRGCRHGRPIA
jgi:hypothetical protein